MPDWLIRALAFVVTAAFVLSLLHFTGLKGLSIAVGTGLVIHIWFRWRFGRYIGDLPGEPPDDGILGRWIARKLRRFAYRPRSS